MDSVTATDWSVADGAMRMGAILGSFCVVIWILCQGQTLAKSKEKGSVARWLPDTDNLAKRQFEIYALQYSAVWIGVFGMVVVTKVYEKFDANAYMILCTSLALPYLLQPVFFPLPAEKNLPLHMRYSFKANVWIALFSFIGNYWYTHYFYGVLQASYDFPSLRLNNVPICLYFATHFYFVTYHSASNLLLRQIETRYREGTYRTALFWTVVVAFSYFTAFMETLTISSYEHYKFAVPRSQIYVLGSAFYGIYFLVSYPVFYRIDEKVNTATGVYPHTLFQTVMESLGTGMLVLLLLDFARLALGTALKIDGVAFCQNANNVSSC
jgi:cycloeucalenol cycloisomerase